jgi:protein-glutamine gamma-glutamyltransferase
MKTPTLFIGSTLLFWGYETGNLAIGAILFILIEASSLIKKKWDFDKNDFVKISDFTSIILIVTITLISLNFEVNQLLFVVGQWMPLIVLPLILAQVYSSGDKIIIGTRLGIKKSKTYAHEPMNFNFIYAAICIFAAALANSRDLIFFPVLVFFTAWVLFANRIKSSSIPLFIATILAASVIGFSGAKGLETGHRLSEKLFLDLWKDYFNNKGTDPYKSTLSFGDMGKIKLSGRIIMRVKTGPMKPLYLREASYQIFSSSTWINTDRIFKRIPVSSGPSWKIAQPTTKKAYIMGIECYLPENTGLIAYPYGSTRITDLDVSGLRKNSSGIVQIEEGASLLSYQIIYNIQNELPEITPGEDNMQIPEKEEYVLKKIIKSLNLSNLSEAEKINRIKSYFNSNFYYSLKLNGKGNYKTELGNFLLHTRAGHCELYATATALLLRMIQIPSRYVTGYCIDEKSSYQDKYIIRERHAHAWTEAYWDGKWHYIDATPAIWLDKDPGSASFFEPLVDFFSYIKHQFNLFRLNKDKKYNFPLTIIIILLTIFLAIRIYLRLSRTKKIEESVKGRKVFVKMDSPFWLIEAKLETLKAGRQKQQTLIQWIEHINTFQPINLKKLRQLYAFHQRLRFDPAGLDNKKPSP